MLAFPAVVDARRLDLDHAGARRHLALLGVAVAHDQAFARLVDYVVVSVQVGLALDQQGHLEHLLGGQTAQLVQADAGGCWCRACGRVLY
jgi:hypothetical protein